MIDVAALRCDAIHSGAMWLRQRLSVALAIGVPALAFGANSASSVTAIIVVAAEGA